MRFSRRGLLATERQIRDTDPFCRRSRDAPTLMRHFLHSPRAVASLPAGVVARSQSTLLVAPARSPHRFPPPDRRAHRRAVDLAAVARRTDAHLEATTGAQKDPMAFPDRALPRQRGWTGRPSATILGLGLSHFWRDDPAGDPGVNDLGLLPFGVAGLLPQTPTPRTPDPLARAAPGPFLYGLRPPLHGPGRLRETHPPKPQDPEEQKPEKTRITRYLAAVHTLQPTGFAGG